MSASQPNPPEITEGTEASEGSVQLTWEAAPNATGYKITVTDFGSDEFAAEHLFDGDTTSGEIDGLYPTSTFQFRLVVVTAEGESPPSNACDVDTAVANCGPEGEGKSGGCAIA